MVFSLIRRGRRRVVGFAGAMVMAMVVDTLLGWPDALFARIGHPVTWLGALIDGVCLDEPTEWSDWDAQLRR